MLEEYLVREGYRCEQAPQTEVGQVKNVELVIEEPNAAVPHPYTMVVHSHNATIAIHATVFSPGRHNLATGLAPCEFANLGHLARVVLNLLFLCAAAHL